MNDEDDRYEVGCELAVPKDIPSEKAIISRWTGDSSQPIVSIICHTFNHVGYIRDALRGFLMQRSTFPFEVIVHDDASNDGTTEILRNYVQIYPKIIKLIAQKENKFSRGEKPSKFTFPLARGRYIAMCEGDDHWTDRKKLQKQVDFLEGNPSFALCATRYHTSGDSAQLRSRPGTYSLNEILLANPFGTLTVLFRRKYLTPQVNHFRLNKPVGDWSLWVALLSEGEGCILPDDTAFYREHEGGIFGGRSKYNQISIKYKTLISFLEDDYLAADQKKFIERSLKVTFLDLLEHHDGSFNDFRGVINQRPDLLSSPVRMLLCFGRILCPRCLRAVLHQGKKAAQTRALAMA